MRIKATFTLESPIETLEGETAFTLADIREIYTDAYTVPSHVDAQLWFFRELKNHGDLWSGDLTDGFKLTGHYSIEVTP